MATIHDVARMAAVAPSTVSLVANGKPHVKPATRQRVQAAMKQLGYRGRASRQTQDAPAGRPDQGRANVLMLYAPYSVHGGAMAQVCREFVNGARQALATRHAHVSLFAGAEHVQEDLMFQHCLEAGEFDGIILLSPHPREGYLEAALRAGVPTVAINRPPRHTEFSSVCVDYCGAGRKAARHLMKLGHRQLAILATPRHERWPIPEYYAGFVDALAEHDLAPALELQPEHGMPDPEEDRAIARRLIDAGATAVFTGDQRAVSLANLLHEQGVSVPDEISVLGLDNLKLLTKTGLRLSSVAFPKRRVGRMSALLMLRLLREPRRFQHACVSIPTRVYRGDTTAAVPGG